MYNENLVKKVSVNINSSTLSSIDVWVDNGYYSNRSDFINQTITESIKDKQEIISALEGHEKWMKVKKRKSFFTVSIL